MFRKYVLYFVGVFLVTLTSCDNGKNGDNDTKDGFDRSEMLIHWADNIIIPHLTEFQGSIAALKSSGESFTKKPDQQSLQNLRKAWLDAYIIWQKVSMFDIGKAEELRFREYMNIYPTDVQGIEKNISSGQYDFTLISKISHQGFPAMDYLLHGVGKTDADILTKYQNSDKHKKYLTDVIVRMQSLTQDVLSDWKGGYRNEFVKNDGNTVSSSVNKLVNSYVKYYEKNVRAGKIGIPVGVFSGNILKDRVEAFYRKDVSKTLFLASLDATQAFFEGKAQKSGSSLKAYLNTLNTVKKGENLSQLIIAQFGKARQQGNKLNDNFVKQLDTDSQAMLKTYDELQKNVVLLKVDMMQALNISVNYVDADGD